MNKKLLLIASVCNDRAATNSSEATDNPQVKGIWDDFFLDPRDVSDDFMSDRLRWQKQRASPKI